MVGVTAGFFAAVTTIVVLEAILAYVVIFIWIGIRNADDTTGLVAMGLGFVAMPIFIIAATIVGWITYRRVAAGLMASLGY
jgi:hypothetical protein